MVSICKFSINAVKCNKPTVLTGLSQKGTWGDQGFVRLLTWATDLTGGKRRPKPILSIKTRSGKPVSPPCASKVGKP